MKDCHPCQEQAKIELLEKLYNDDGRTSKEHPNYGLYTGLYQNWLALNTKAANLNEEPAL